MNTRLISVCLLLSSVFSWQAFANPGDPDPTFGFGGTTVDNPVNYPCYGMFPNAMTLQADGKILVVGKIYNACSSAGFSNDPLNLRRVLLRRYLSNGTPDNGGGTQGGFGMDGFAVNEIPISPTVYGEAFDVLVQPDGYILVAGIKAARVGTSAVVWRFTPYGELDTTFGADGIVIFTSSGTTNASKKLALSNGKIVVAGYSGNASPYQAWVRKLNPDGSPYVWFGPGGKITTGISPYVGGMSLAIDPSTGHILVGGETNGSSAVQKYTSTGAIVTSFGNSGMVILPGCQPGAGYVPTSPFVALDLRFQTTGKLLVASRMNFGGFAQIPGIHRLTASGAIDPTFDDPSQPDMCDAVMTSNTWIRELPNDYFYAGGYRHLADGVRDTTFTAFASGLDAEIQPADGKIVHVSYETIIKPNGTGFDSKVKLLRALP